MATRGKKISEQTLAASLDGNEVIPFAKNGASGAVKASKIKEWIEPDLTAKQDKLVNSADITVGEDDKLSVTEETKRKVFDDLWIKAAGSFGTVDHTHTEDGVNKPYYLNEVWMTYEEALVVYNEYYSSVESLQQRIIYGVTNFAPTENGSSMSFTNFIAPNAVTLNIGTSFLTTGFIGWLAESRELTKIIGRINLQYWKTSPNSVNYLTCPKLKEVSLYHLSNNFNISSLKSISLASMQYMVNNSTATSSITVTVHPDVYAKLTGDTTNAAAAALTSDELAQWTALATTANSKNISFATPE